MGRRELLDSDRPTPQHKALRMSIVLGSAFRLDAPPTDDTVQVYIRDYIEQFPERGYARDIRVTHYEVGAEKDLLPEQYHGPSSDERLCVVVHAWAIPGGLATVDT